MALGNRATNNTVSTSFGGPRGFVPATVVSEDLVTVMLLGRKGSARESILQTDAQGKERGQVLLNLVGVVLPLLDEQGREELNEKGEVIAVCYPDEKVKLPPVGSVGFDMTMKMGTGLFVESIYASGIQKLVELAEQGYLPGLTADDVKKAANDGSLNRRLENRGKYLRAVGGIFEKYELTVADVMSGEKTMSITFFGDEAEAFAESYNRLQDTFKFQNIALCARVSGNMQATELKSGISYQPDEVHFFWKETAVGNRTQFLLDADFAKSGKSYSAQTVNATDAADLARKGSNINYNRNMDAINNGSDIRNARRNEQLIKIANQGKLEPATAVPGMGDY